MAPKEYTYDEVAKHNTPDDCWMVINGMAVDITEFLQEHPGGEEVLLELAGKEATSGFDDVGHSDEAIKMLADYKKGPVKGAPKAAEKKVSAGGAGGDSGVSFPLVAAALLAIGAIVWKFVLKN